MWFDDRQMEALLMALPPAAVAELDEILQQARAQNTWVDAFAIGQALLRAHIVQLPPLPPKYQGDARLFELHMNVDPTDRDQMLRAREQYLRECDTLDDGARNGARVRLKRRRYRRRRFMEDNDEDDT